jgi:hypothetical protein
MNKQFSIFIAFMLLGVFTAKATIHTVSNDPDKPARWNNLQTACDSAMAGDTIYITGSLNNYGAVSFAKTLHLIGSGIKPVNNNQYGLSTLITSITLDTVNNASGASGSIIEGITITGGISIGQSANVIIRRNRISVHNQYSGVITGGKKNTQLINCILTIYGPGVWVSGTNYKIMNNIMECQITGANSTTLISNNIFLGLTNSFNSCSYTNVFNNIFYFSGVTSGITYSTFSNNIGYGITIPFVQGNNNGTGNLSSDPIFVYKSSGNTYSDIDKYRLNSNSPGKNAGTDGADMGIYGGQHPWPPSAINDYIHCITPMIPVVQELIIQNSSVPANGNLNFSVKAYKTSK